MVKEKLKDSRQYKELCKKENPAYNGCIEKGPAWQQNVPLTWCVRFDLTTLELLTYCYIRDCTRNMKEKAFTGSIKGLQSKFNTSAPTQRLALEHLQEKGFIIKERAPFGESNWVRYVDTLRRYYEKEDPRPMEVILEYYAYRYEEEKKRQVKSV